MFHGFVDADVVMITAGILIVFCAYLLIFFFLAGINIWMTYKKKGTIGDILYLYS